MSKSIAVIDSETDPFGSRDASGALFVPRPFIWGFDDGERYREFDTVKELVEFLTPQKIIVYAHNGGKFDYHFLLPFLDGYSEVLIINGRLSRFMIGECEFRDSYNILPIPLGAYKKDEFDYSKMDAKNRQNHMPEIRRYLRNDCKYLLELVTKFRETYGGGITLAGCAFKYWQTHFDKEAPQTTADFYNDISPFYYGGRVQCFAHGIIDRPFRLVDINSAYPHAMLHDHPISTSCVDVGRVLKTDPIIQQSLYTVRAISRGALPFRHKGKLTFPTDHFLRTYTVTGWELEAGIDTGTVEVYDIPSRLDFGNTINFVDYVGHFYAMKNSVAKESPDYVFAKLFLNSLYGKFGANPENYANYGIVPVDKANWFVKPDLAAQALESSDSALDIGKHHAPYNDGKDGFPVGYYWQAAGTLGPWALLQGDLAESEQRYYNLATAASITGFVRAYLWRHICKIREAGGELLYCDTDSIAFAGAGIEQFTLSRELGDWGIDGEFVRGGIAGKKLYAFEYTTPKVKDGATITHKTASKGVRLDADQIMRIAAGETILTEHEAPTFSVHAEPRFVSRRIKATNDG